MGRVREPGPPGNCLLSLQPLPPHVRIWDSVSLSTLHVLGLGVFDRAVCCVGFSKSVSPEHARPWALGCPWFPFGLEATPSSCRHGCWPRPRPESRAPCPSGCAPTVAASPACSGGSAIKNSLACVGWTGLIPESGRSPGGGNGQPALLFLPAKALGRGGLQAAVYGVERVRRGLATKQQ